MTAQIESSIWNKNGRKKAKIITIETTSTKVFISLTLQSSKKIFCKKLKQVEWGRLFDSLEHNSNFVNKCANLTNFF